MENSAYDTSTTLPGESESKGVGPLLPSLDETTTHKLLLFLFTFWYYSNEWSGFGFDLSQRLIEWIAVGCSQEY